MEAWVPLFEIFLRSPTPETDFSLWVKQCCSDSAEQPLSTSSFISLLGKPQDVVVLDPLPQRSRVMFRNTLPPFVRSRIPSFLAYEHRRFDCDRLSEFVTHVLSEHGKIDFWVERAACHLFDIMRSVREPERSSRTRWGREEGGLCSEFESIPDWLKCVASSDSALFPWVPMVVEMLSSDESVDCRGDMQMLSQTSAEEKHLEIAVAEKIEVDFPEKMFSGFRKF